MTTYRVIGPPGCGKTTYVARQTAHAVEKYGEEGALICSLTKAAAAEAAGRHTGLAEHMVGTLHAHCYRVLGSPEVVERKHIKQWNEDHPEWSLSPGVLDRDSAGGDDPEGIADGIYMEVELHRACRTDMPVVALEFHEAWTDWKRELGLVDFTDMIAQALEERPLPPYTPEVLFADEAQDLSALELALLEKWARHVDHLILVGDREQALYSWRGASPDVMSGDAFKVLEQSYRVPKAVHTEAMKVLRDLDDGIEITYHPTQQDGRVEFGGFQYDEFAAYLPMIEEEIVAEREVMVLTSCAYMLIPILRVLRQEGIPYFNPYSGRWNPLDVAPGNKSAVAALKAFLSQKWTGHNAQAVAPYLLTKTEHGGALKRGAKKRIKELEPGVDAFGLLAEVLDPEAIDPFFEGDLRWFVENVVPSKRRSFEYPLAVIERDRGALAKVPRVIPGTVHCSPGDEPILTRRGYVPLSKLRSDDRLVSFDVKTHRFFGHTDSKNPNAQGYAFERSERPYKGKLITVDSSNSRTRITPNHRIPVRLEPQFFGKWIVYLMRRGDWWRVGMCVSGHRPYKSGGVSGRLATEQADAGWILGVYASRKDAVIAEARIHAGYGIPGLTFQSAKARLVSSRELHEIHREFVAWVAPRAQRLLRDIGSHPDWPLYRRGRGWKKNTTFTVESGTLMPLSGYVAVPTFDGDFKPTFCTATLSEGEYEGSVYGLDIPPYHHYVSGGAAVHNSVKGGEADTVLLFPDLSPKGKAQLQRYGWDGGDAVRRMFYVGITRAKDRLVIGRAKGRDAYVW